MTPDTALDPIEQPIQQPPSTAGMTTKVVKGSMWTLAGSVLPLAVSFISTPFIIRFLGAESYGVLLLVGLIPTYFSFADFGMSIASTKFASEAFGEGDRQKEADVVWTATAVGLVATLLVAIPIILFAPSIVASLNTPEHLQSEAATALRISCVAFVLGVLASILNSPMLARLRMDFNTITQSVPKVLLAAVTPFILFFGLGIIGAVTWALIISVAAFVAVFYFSCRLLPQLISPGFDKKLLGPLLKFGAGILAASLAGILLVNFEKLALSKLTSVTSLAYYSVAYTLANIAMMFSTAMTQALVPAFSQLLTPHKKGELDSLFGSTIRITIVGLLPLVVFLWIAAGPFFHFWAGEEFGRESTLPFHILLIGVAFNMLAFIQHSLITSMGRTTLIAVLYWIEFVLYAVISVGLIYWLGIVGAALAWTIRVIVDSIVFIILGQKMMGMSFKFRDQVAGLFLPFLALVPVIVLALFTGDSQTLLLGIVAPISFAIYAVLIWKGYLHTTERSWISGRFSRILGAGS